VDDALFLVCIEAGLFDGVVKPARIPHLLEGKLWVGLVCGYQPDRADTENAVQEVSAKLQIHHAEHIQIVNLPVENPSAPLDAVGRDLVIGHLELGRCP
jgi:hypothetical protein